MSQLTEVVTDSEIVVPLTKGFAEVSTQVLEHVQSGGKATAHAAGVEQGIKATAAGGTIALVGVGVGMWIGGYFDDDDDDA